MATLSSYFVEETNYMRDREDEEDEEDEDEVEDEEEEDRNEEEKEEEKDESAVQKQQRPAWAPSFFYRLDKQVYNYVGQEIIIEEALDSFAGMIWPAALALCHYLDTHRDHLSLVDKAVLEIGAGTGLVSVVAALLGAWVTATDLPVVLSNLRVNLSRNTRGRCRHTPQVAALSWGYDLERSYPTSVYHYDYVLAADVVYHHDFLDELLVTMKHFCTPGTTLIWANKVRFETDLTFTENFKKAFHTSVLAEDGEMKIFMATCREEEGDGDMGVEIQDLLSDEEEEKRQDDEDEKGQSLKERMTRKTKTVLM
ncbi:protein-lysine methyltransferase METTL21C-like [Chelmon rostratus]|uniref:protein-lysine methyltransferase METTL21C-like n=1 Tax=Chelmon rostratus TaxID=109905 RepID=UPI001BECD434|nr:protein-lysine methyltransferase METTL21C-like [Chelmon rostratus]